MRYGVTEIRNIAVVGHGDSGKTSLTSLLLFAAGATTRLGSVDEGNTVTDFADEEIRRKITVQTSLAHLDWKGHRINLLDTPGYGDFVYDANVAQRSVDASLLVICGVSGVQVYAEKVWHRAVELDQPAAVVINKLDRERSSFRRAFDSCREAIGKRLVAVQIPLGQEAEFRGVIDLISRKAIVYGADQPAKPQITEIPPELADDVDEYRERLVEAVAEQDDDLVEKYLEGEELTEDEIRRGLRTAVLRRAVVPALAFSSTKGVGAIELLDFITANLPSPADRPAWTGKDPATGAEVARHPREDEPFSAFVFKTIADAYAGRISLFRVISGAVSSDTNVWNGTRDSGERIGQLVQLQGKEHRTVAAIGAGDFGAIAKLRATHTGDTLCAQADPVVFEPDRYPSPLLYYGVQPKSRGDEEKINAALHRLVEEDPMLRFERDERTKQQLLKGAGQLHIEVTMEKLRQKFGVEADLIPPRVPYTETLRGSAKGIVYRHKKQTGGRGQFAEVHIDVMAKPRGEGFEFEEALVGMNVPRNFVPAVEKGIRELLEDGVVAGYPVTDIKVRFYDGKSHEVDSSEMAFKIAARQAFKQAFVQCKPVLLEPVMTVEILAPDDAMGDLMGDLTSRRGKPVGVEQSGSLQSIKAYVPLAEMLTYAPDLRSITGGRGTFTMEFDHYEEMPDNLAQKVIAASGKKIEEE
ncbi:MAG: elongation factor G [Candidatus Schekmanbacteria bacterium]|nr:elongation factor G [Candidatus Schekmanbacteria bacterium]